MHPCKVSYQWKITAQLHQVYSSRYRQARYIYSLTMYRIIHGVDIQRTSPADDLESPHQVFCQMESFLLVQQALEMLYLAFLQADFVKTHLSSEVHLFREPKDLNSCSKFQSLDQALPKPATALFPWQSLIVTFLEAD